MSMLVSHSMRFCTDNFGFNLSDTASSGETTLTGGGDGWTAADDDSTKTISPGSSATVAVGDGDYVSVKTGTSDQITVSGGTQVTVTGGSAATTLTAYGGTPVTVTGGGGNVIIFSSTIIHDYGGGGDSTDESLTDDGTSTETGKLIPFVKKALMRGNKTWDCTDKTAVLGFQVIKENLDYRGTDCRVIFNVYPAIHASDVSRYYILKKSAVNPFTAEPVALDCDMSTNALRLENILKYGNTIAEIQNFNNIPDFVGKRVSPWYALQASSDAIAMPKIRLDLKTRVDTDITAQIYETDVYTLSAGGAAPIISEITPKVTTEGGGSVDITVKLFGENDTVGSDWMSLDSAIDQTAYAIQFKFICRVLTARANDMARVDSIVVKHSYGEAIVSGDAADIYTIVTNYEVPLQMCYVVVRHNQLIDSSIKAYVNFMHKPKHRELIYLGLVDNDSEGKTELVLGVDGVPDKNIDASSIKIFHSAYKIGDEEITSFTFSSENNSVTISGEPNTRPIYASYDYNIDVEVWREMTLDVTEPYAGTATYATRFTYTLPDDEARPSDSDLAKVISNVKIEMIRGKGTSECEDLKALTTGKRQLFVLNHTPDVSTIKFTNAAGTTEYGSSSLTWKFNEDTNILSVVGKTKNLPLFVTYDWVGETVVINSIACGWSVA